MTVFIVKAVEWLVANFAEVIVTWLFASVLFGFCAAAFIRRGMGK